MKRFYVKSRIALITFALGMAAVYMSNGLSIASNDVDVNLPVVESDDNVLVVFPASQEDVYPFGYVAQKREAIGKRDLSLYEIGEFADECFFESEYKDCMAKRQAAKRFIVDHLANQRRGYIEIGIRCSDCSPVFHVFIEPDRNGHWGFVITLTTNGPGRTARGHKLKFRRPNREEKERGYNEEMLSFINDYGKEEESF